VTLCGALSHGVRRGADIHGNVTRLDYAIDAFGDTIRRLEADLVSTKEQMETAKAEVDRSFPQESEYREKSALLNSFGISSRVNPNRVLRRYGNSRSIAMRFSIDSVSVKYA
jgi:hypothetical protein